MAKKLELTWVGKEERPRLEPRILLEDPERSYVAAERVSEDDLFDNRLIFGDNLLALKALDQEFSGKVKCIFIDPPYNTRAAFEHYKDNLEHSVWLSLMRDRLELLRRLLSEDGSIWITIDDHEAHYLKVLCDEVFGRSNFMSDIIWQKKYSPQPDANTVTPIHDHVLAYAKNLPMWRMELLPRDEKALARYKNPDNDPRGPWKSGDLSSKTKAAGHSYPVRNPNTGEEFLPPPNRQWAPSLATFQKLMADNRIYFGPKGDRGPALKQFLTEVQQGTKAVSIWSREEVGDNQLAKREALSFNSVDVFETPKPEALVRRVLQLASRRGDLVLDSFAGSGTTGAVAHKMGRRWIMVELGEHCHTHILPRMKQVIDGTDQGGISKDVGWKGGGGFRYYSLASSLLKQDKWGRWVINESYNPEMLSEAICKLEGYTFAPSDTVYWQHGRSTERAFIYVTTQALTHEQLLDLSEEVGPDRSLLVMAMAFRGSREQDYPNLTLKKIPNQVLGRCEWGKDDYSLKVENLPMAKSAEVQQAALFDAEGEEEA